MGCAASVRVVASSVREADRRAGAGCWPRSGCGERTASRGNGGLEDPIVIDTDRNSGYTSESRRVVVATKQLPG